MSIKEKVYKEISYLSISRTADIRDDQSLRRDLCLDSLDIVELAIQLETEFDIDIPDELIEQWDSPIEVYNFIATKMEEE